MSKASRILLVALLGLTVSLLLGATDVAPVAEAAPAVAPVAYAQAASGSGAGSGSGSGYGHASGEAVAGTVWVESGGSYLGVDTQDVTKERMTALKLKEESGVEVRMVDRDAPAGKAGLKEHDVIQQFNGAKVESVEQLRRMIREVPPGRTVTLGISRDGQPLTLNATLAERKKNYEFNYAMPKIKAPKVVIPKVEMPDMHEFQFVVAGSGRAGLLVENLTPQLGEFFGVKDGAGVLVRSVEKGSPAEAAGFRAGDVIIRVEQDKVADRGDWRSTLRSHRSGKISVGIIRDKREQTLSLAIPEAKEQSSTWRPFGLEMDLDLDDLNIDLEDMDIEINQLGPQMELLRPQMERLKPQMELLKPQMERLKPQMERLMEKLRPQMEQMKRELSARLSASLTQGRDQLRQAMELTREQVTSATRQTQTEATRAARQAQREAQRALEQQRKELEKVREMMRRRAEMD